MDEKLINFEEFSEWHNPDGQVTDSKLSEGYEVYKNLFAENGKDFADETICGHEIWDN